MNPTYCGDLWRNGLFRSQGNSNLKPEKNVSYSIGLQRKFLDEKGETKLTVFKETLTGEITAGPWPTFSQQTLMAKVDGMELNLT